MSLRATTLDDFQTNQPETTTPNATPTSNDESNESADKPTRPEWTQNVDSVTNHQCNNCGASVSPRYHSFHRDENDVLRRCQNCRTQTNMKNGAGAVDDYERRGRDDTEEQTPTESLFGPVDTGNLPSYLGGNL